MAADDADDAALLVASRNDPARFTAVFERHYDAVHAYLIRRVPPDTADELAAETFVRALAARRRYDSSSGSVRGWLFGIATNLGRQHWRGEERRLRAYARACFPPDGADSGDMDARADAQRQRGALAEALAALPAADRDVLLLHAWADLSHAEIAAALGIPVGTVRSRLSRARTRVRERIGAIGEVMDEGATEGAGPWTSST